MIKLFKNVELRNKLLFSILVIIVFRFLAHVPVPGVNLDAVRTYLKSSVFFGLFDLISGGGFQNFSIITLGLQPYINASIIVQLFTKMIPSLEELSKEGESGREKINLYTKLLSVPVALLQAYGVYFLLSKQGVIDALGTLNLAVLILTLLGGAMLMVWLGDLLTEYGVGQGTSLLIFVGIVSRLPTGLLTLSTLASSLHPLLILLFILISILLVMVIVLVNEGTRNIPLEYGRRDVRSQKVTNYLPIKINQSGVIPIIFAVSIVLLPSLLSGPLLASGKPTLQSVGIFLASNFNQNAPMYNILYFLLVFGFTFFYTFMQFNPEKVSEDIKKRGGFIPGIRPGLATTRYLRDVTLKLTLLGASFLGLIAIMPYFVQLATGMSNLAVGGTSILIVVSVVLETVRQIESMMVTRNYDNFLR